MAATLCDADGCLNGRDVTIAHPLGAGEVHVCVDHWNTIQYEQAGVILRKLRVS